MPDSVILDVGGVGFLVQISGETASRLSSMGSGAPVKIYTYTYVREDALNLYGFLSRDELALYRSLITVSGIGPKGGLALLSGMSADDLRFAIITGDVKAISRAPGIGKKLAQRILLERTNWSGRPVSGSRIQREKTEHPVRRRMRRQRSPRSDTRDPRP